MGTETNILEICDIYKQFGGINALNGIKLSIRENEIHAIVGENGAGKSTLIKLITGAITPTSGIIKFAGKEYGKMNPALALDMGITAIYQEFNLIPSMTVAENIFFGCEKMNKFFIDSEGMNEKTTEIFQAMGVDIDPKAQIQTLGIARQQLVEIAKAISKNVKFIIMDEPSAPLTEREIETLHKIVRQLKERHITIIYISHRLEEVFEICDRVSVFRDGCFISTKNVSDTNREQLITDMVGRKIGETYPERGGLKDEVILEVKSIVNQRLNDVSIQLRRGEILGLGGLVGAGRTELVRAIYGADRIFSGEIILHGSPVKIRKPIDALNNGIGLLPEDRKSQGLVMGMGVAGNITLAILKKLSGFFFLEFNKEKELCTKLAEDLSIKIIDLESAVKNLSGGNQQKVVLAKILATKCNILIIDEPTRGIDVGAKQEIYKVMRKLADSGKSIIMISSEMSELIGMSDRIIVMCEGKITKEFYPPEYSQEAILNYASL